MARARSALLSFLVLVSACSGRPALPELPTADAKPRTEKADAQLDQHAAELPFKDGPPCMLCDGKCVDPTKDPANCGGCGLKCTGGKRCVSSRCMCPPQEPDDCFGKCTSLATDALNCSSCGHACGVGCYCVGGQCMIECGSPNKICGSGCGVCVNVYADPNHCGDCYVVCTGGKQCVNGKCACAQPLPDECGGVCTSLLSDAKNCGVCGKTCSQTCQSGKCSP